MGGNLVGMSLNEEVSSFSQLAQMVFEKSDCCVLNVSNHLPSYFQGLFFSPPFFQPPGRKYVQ